MNAKIEKVVDFLIYHIDRLTIRIDAYVARTKAEQKPQEQPQPEIKPIVEQIAPIVEKEIIISREAILNLLQKQDGRLTMKDLMHISKSS